MFTSPRPAVVACSDGFTVDVGDPSVAVYAEGDRRIRVPLGPLSDTGGGIGFDAAEVATWRGPDGDSDVSVEERPWIVERLRCALLYRGGTVHVLGAEAGVLSRRWRRAPRLEGRFHPDTPDDVRVIVHDGGPLCRDTSPEVVWVTVAAWDGHVFTGVVSSEPAALRDVARGQPVRFVVNERPLHPRARDFPVLVREDYLRERAAWIVSPCASCGLAELFDPPSALFAAAAPGLPSLVPPRSFTTVCPLCGGELAVRATEAGIL